MTLRKSVTMLIRDLYECHTGALQLVRDLDEADEDSGYARGRAYAWRASALMLQDVLDANPLVDLPRRVLGSGTQLAFCNIHRSYYVVDEGCYSCQHPFGYCPVHNTTVTSAGCIGCRNEAADKALHSTDYQTQLSEARRRIKDQDALLDQAKFQMKIIDGLREEIARTRGNVDHFARESEGWRQAIFALARGYDSAIAGLITNRHMHVFNNTQPCLACAKNEATIDANREFAAKLRQLADG